MRALLLSLLLPALALSAVPTTNVTGSFNLPSGANPNNVTLTLTPSHEFTVVDSSGFGYVVPATPQVYSIPDASAVSLNIIPNTGRTNAPDLTTYTVKIQAGKYSDTWTWQVGYNTNGIALKDVFYNTPSAGTSSYVLRTGDTMSGKLVLSMTGATAGLNMLPIVLPGSSPSVGDIAISSSDYKMYIWNGSTWVSPLSGITSVTHDTSLTGAGTGGSPLGVAPGTPGYIMVTNTGGTGTTWAPPLALKSGGTVSDTSTTTVTFLNTQFVITHTGTGTDTVQFATNSVTADAIAASSVGSAKVDATVTRSDGVNAKTADQPYGNHGITNLSAITFTDQSANPSTTAGKVQRNGTSLLMYDGTTARPFNFCKYIIRQTVEQTTGGTLGTGDTVANSTVDNLFATNGTVAANELNVAGRFLHIIAFFRYSDTGGPTIRIKWKLGSVTLDDTGAFTCRTGVTNSPVRYEGYATVRTTGATGTVIANDLFVVDFSNVAAGPLVWAAASTNDLTSSQTVQLSAMWGTASSSNTITMQQCICTLEGN